jgi:glycosyltransferase involved in cell wall biosynthesis
MADSSQNVLLYVITKAEFGGAQQNVYDLIAAFRKSYTVHLATGCQGPLVENVAALGVPVHILPSLTRNIELWGDIKAVTECLTLIKAVKPSLIHAHSSKAGVIARVAGWISQVPVTFTAHGWGFTPGTPQFRRYLALYTERVMAAFSAQIICVSDSDRQLALDANVGTAKQLTTICYGIPNQAVAMAQPDVEPPRLIMVARFNEQKDQATLLQSIAQIRDRSFHLDLVGTGPSLSSCQALADSLGLTMQVSFLGDRADVPALLAQAQIFILSTHYEGLPISILEAMRAGLPVIATGVNGIPEEIEHGKTGLLVPRQDIKALATALESLIQSPEQRRCMGEAGRQRFLHEFTLDKMVMKTEAIYAHLAKQ